MRAYIFNGYTFMGSNSAIINSYLIGYQLNWDFLPTLNGKNLREFLSFQRNFLLDAFLPPGKQIGSHKSCFTFV